jgi:hypothetical protein
MEGYHLYAKTNTSARLCRILVKHPAAEPGGLDVSYTISVFVKDDVMRPLSKRPRKKSRKKSDFTILSESSDSKNPTVETREINTLGKYLFSLHPM